MDDLPSPSRLPMPSSSSQLPKRDASKRRSLLLPPGSIAGAAKRGGFLSPTEEEPQKQRPISMIAPMRNLRSLSEKIELEEESDSQSSETRERAREEAHAALMGGSKVQPAATTGQKSGIARSTSVRAPSVSRIGSLRSQDSSQSRIGARDMPGLKEKGSRPESMISTTTRSTTEAPTSRLRTPASATNGGGTGVRRPAATALSRHSRTQSALAPQSSHLTQSRNEVRRHPTISEGSESRLHRPAFSTLQQHYSPKKNLAPKPASSTLIHSQPIDTGSSLGMDSQLIQTRLLQLSILHRQAEPAYQAWSASAKRKLKHKFTDVAAECEVVRQKEKDWHRRINTAALLKEWSTGDLGLLAENVGTLSNVVNEVMQLVEEGGRVHQSLEMFEAWITWVEAVYSGRDQRGEQQGRNAEFIDGLGDGWKSETAALVRKLSTLARQLDGLGAVQEASSLSEILSGFRELIKGLIQELKAVDALEGEVVRREGKWVDEQIGGLDRELEALLA